MTFPYVSRGRFDRAQKDDELEDPTAVKLPKRNWKILQTVTKKKTL